MPAPERTTRHRLVAILVADVAGYSRLMSLDDQATVAALEVGREIFRDRVAAHAGRIVDMAGDSVLAIFDTAIGALKAALEVQDRMAAVGVGVDVAAGDRMRFRIGVHLGDVIEKADGTVYGDGVNIAARLEGLAHPGGIAVSQSIESSIHHRVKVRFVDIGEQRVKNIAHPVRAFLCEPAAESATGGGELAPQSPALAVGVVDAAAQSRRLRPVVLVAACMLGVVLAGTWLVARQWFDPAAATAYSARDRRMTFAVLPFVAPADDIQAGKIGTAVGEAVAAFQEKNIWAQLVPRALVDDAARRHASARELGRALDVHFLVRGVVRAEPPGYRVDLSVVDTATDRLLESKSIAVPAGASLPKRRADIGVAVSELTFSALVAEVERARATPVEALDVRDLTFRAYADWSRADDGAEPSKATYDAASSLLNRALALAPDDSPSLFVTVFVNLCSCVASWSKDVREQQAIATAAMEKYLRKHPDSPAVLMGKSELYRQNGRFEESLLVADSVLGRDPENRGALYLRTSALMHLGRDADALAASNQLLQLAGDDATEIALAAAVSYRVRDYARAAALAQKASTLMEGRALADPIAGSILLTLVASEGQLGHGERSAAARRDFVARVPSVTTIAAVRKWLHPSADLTDFEPLYDGLRLAGIPD